MCTNSDALKSKEAAKIDEAGQAPLTEEQHQNEAKYHPAGSREPGLERTRNVGKADTSAADRVNTSVKHKNPDLSNDKPSKKMKLSDDSGNVSGQLHKENSEKNKPSEKKVKSLDESLQKPPPPASGTNNNVAENQMIVARNPYAVSFSIHHDVHHTEECTEF